ncbi:P-loop NTPase fold protein [Bacillus sp. SIMBA_069]
MNVRVTSKKKIKDITVQQIIEEFLMILLLAAFLFFIEGLLDETLFSNQIKETVNYIKNYWFVIPIISVLAVIWVYGLVKNKYLKRIINYPAFTFKFDRWMISAILSILLYCFVTQIRLLKGTLIEQIIILGLILLLFYFTVIMLRNRKTSSLDNGEEEGKELDEQSYCSDLAIKNSGADKLNRSEFAIRLAKSVNSWKEEESIVIGIYGEWGSGKTSVLNLMQEEFNTKQDTILVPFNPWYFKDEEQLILQFFNKLITEVEKNFFGEKSKLITNIKAYSQKITSVTLRMGVVNFSFKDFLGNKEESNDIFSLKKIIEEQLEMENKRIVVLIDDIDRLDDKEIHSVFKLVKAIADFNYTTYILAFDEEIVARVLSTQYSGKQTIDMGQSFLEKIIQVPLYLPPIDQIDIQNILYSEIKLVLEKNQISLSNDDETRFQMIWEGSFGRFPLTIRAVKRYQNSIVFSLPLVKEEVNIVDFLCIEGIRVFLPDIYKFIYKHSDAFLTAGEAKMEGRMEEYKSIIGEAFKSFPVQEKKNIDYLIYDLFPMSKYLFTGQKNSKRIVDKNWALEKRICSVDYFNKYFVYSVREGQVSDKKFNDLLNGLKTMDIDSAIDKIKDIISTRNYSMFIGKFQARLEELEPEQAENLIRCLVRIEDLIPAGGNGYSSNQWQTAMLISGLLKLQQKNRRENIIKTAIQSISSLLFALVILKHIELLDAKDSILKEAEIERVVSCIIDRMRQEINNENFLDEYGVHSSMILVMLYKRGNEELKNELAISIAKWMKKQDGIEKLLIGFGQKSYNSKSDTYNFGKFDGISYLNLKYVVGLDMLDYMNETLINKYSVNSLKDLSNTGKTDFEKVAVGFWYEHLTMLEETRRDKIKN